MIYQLWSGLSIPSCHLSNLSNLYPVLSGFTWISYGSRSRLDPSFVSYIMPVPSVFSIRLSVFQSRPDQKIEPYLHLFSLLIWFGCVYMETVPGNLRSKGGGVGGGVDSQQCPWSATTKSGIRNPVTKVYRSRTGFFLVWSVWHSCWGGASLSEYIPLGADPRPLLLRNEGR